MKYAGMLNSFPVCSYPEGFVYLFMYGEDVGWYQMWASFFSVSVRLAFLFLPVSTYTWQLSQLLCSENSAEGKKNIFLMNRSSKCKTLWISFAVKPDRKTLWIWHSNVIASNHSHSFHIFNIFLKAPSTFYEAGFVSFLIIKQMGRGMLGTIP